jgi:hypothetical protein
MKGTKKATKGKKKEKLIGDYLCFIEQTLDGEKVMMPALVFPSYIDMLHCSPLPKIMLDDATYDQLADGLIEGIRAGKDAGEPFALVLGKPRRGFLGTEFETGKLGYCENFGEFFQQYSYHPSYMKGIREALAIMKISAKAEKKLRPARSGAPAESGDTWCSRQSTHQKTAHRSSTGTSLDGDLGLEIQHQRESTRYRSSSGEATAVTLSPKACETGLDGHPRNAILHKVRKEVFVVYESFYMKRSKLTCQALCDNQEDNRARSRCSSGW